VTVGHDLLAPCRTADKALSIKVKCNGQGNPLNLASVVEKVSESASQCSKMDPQRLILRGGLV